MLMCFVLLFGVPIAASVVCAGLEVFGARRPVSRGRRSLARRPARFFFLSSWGRCLPHFSRAKYPSRLAQWLALSPQFRRAA
jgi:hypothetical protein